MDMKTITIGDKPLKELSKEDIIELVLIEKCHKVLEFWGQPVPVGIDKKTFPDTIVLDFEQSRIEDGYKGGNVVFFLDIEKLSFHHYVENSPGEHLRKSSLLNIHSLKYLIKNGFDIPIY